MKHSRNNRKTGIVTTKNRHYKRAKDQNKQGLTGQGKNFGIYFKHVEKSLKGFSKRMT